MRLLPRFWKQIGSPFSGKGNDIFELYFKVSGSVLFILLRVYLFFEENRNVNSLFGRDTKI